MMLSNLSATVLFVEDLAKCMTFYENVFGLKDPYTDDVSAAYRIGDHDFVLLKTSAATAMVGEEPLSLDKGAPRVLLCVGVKDVDATYKELTAKGVAFLKPPKSQDWGRRTAYLADPEGNLWELWHPLK